MTEGRPAEGASHPRSPEAPTAGAAPERGLTALATRRPVGVTMVVLSIALFGWISFDRLPRNLMPDISYPSITVRTEYPGAAPVDVETRVSRRLEEVLAQVRNLRRVSSVSRAEVSDVILEFAWDTEMSLAITEVREKVAQAFLPDDATTPTFLRYDPTLDPILQIGVYQETTEGRGEEDVLLDLRILAEEELERELESLTGVAGVRVRGGLEKEVRIDVDEQLLGPKGVTMSLVEQRIRAENLNQSSGILYEGSQSRLVRTVNEFANLDEIRDIILRRDGDVPIRLREVAEVSFGWRDPEVITRIDGRPCVKIDIYKEADANVVDVAQAVRDRIFGTPEEQVRLQEIERREREAAARRARGPSTAEGETTEAGGGGSSKETKTSSGGSRRRRRGPGGGPPPGGGGGWERPQFLTTRLPARTRVEVMSDQSVFIRAALDDVRRTVFTGGTLAILVLFLFLRSAWFTLAVGLSIPLSVLATFVVMDQCGVSLNMMSLGGLALGIGMLVDNSVVVLESIFRCREDGDGPREAAVRGTGLVSAAVTASTLTTVAVFFPIVFVEGIAGQVFQEQALTVVISLLASLAAALYFIPAMVGRHLQRAPAGEGQRPDALRRLLAQRRTFGPLRMFARRAGALRWKRWYAPLHPVWILAFLLPSALLAQVIHTASALALRTLRLAGLLGRVAWIVLRPLRRAAGGGIFGAFDRIYDLARAAYVALLGRALAHRAVVLALAVVAAVATGRLFLRLDTELIPEVHQGEFTVEIRLPRSTRIEETDRVVKPWEERLLAERESLQLASVTSTVGVEKDELAEVDEGEHSAKLLVRLAPSRDPLGVEERAKSRIRSLLRDAEFESVEVVNPVLFTFKTPIEVEVSGYDLDVLAAVVEQVRRRMATLAELEDVKSTLARGNPEVMVRLDRDLLSRYGLDMSQVGELIRRKVQGEVASYFTLGDRKVPIRVRLREDDRDSLLELREVQLDVAATPNGRDLRLRDVLRRDGPTDGASDELPIGEGPAEIRRIAHQRAALVTANLAGMSLGSATDAVSSSLADVDYPPEFRVGFGGQKEEMDRAMGSLQGALLLAIFLVYVVMAIQFESLVQPFVIIFAIPLALVGVVPVLVWLGEPLSIIVFIGMIVLAGIVVNNAIVLIDTANQIHRSGATYRAALIRAGELRLRPILMTTATTVLGLLPLTGLLNGVEALEPLLGSGQGTEIRAPLAITVIAGLITSTVLTLVVIPVLASVIQGVRSRLSGGGESGDEGAEVAHA